MPLTNCEFILILTWYAICVIVSTAVANQGEIFATNDAKLYVPVVTLSTRDNVKPLDQLRSGFAKTVK